jgi:signal transduction histidine kinase
LIPELIFQCLQKVQGYTARRISRTVVGNTAAQLCTGELCGPLRAAIQAIEEDPDTVLDVDFLLRTGLLPRNEAHQSVLRTGIDRLQLSGAVVLAGETYRIKNDIYRQGLLRHFGQNRVAHVLRMNGRWQEAIQYLSAVVEAPPHAPEKVEAGHTDLLEAIVQSIYAADSEEEAYQALLEGIHLGFHLSGIRIYRAHSGRRQLQLVATDLDERSSVPPVGSINLNDYAQAEVRTFRSGGHALRGEVGSKRLLVPLTPERRPIGMVTIESFSSETEPHAQPPELPGLLRFLRHASGALENVVLRAAIQKIGRAVLDAGALTVHLDNVLDVVLDAAGADAAELYVLNRGRQYLTRVAHAGDTAIEREALTARIELSLTGHPVVAALETGVLTAERQAVPAGLYAYLPLVARGHALGTLAVCFAGEVGGLSAGDRKTLATFADQVAIAVHNHQLLRMTDTELRATVSELQDLRRQAEQQRDEELLDVANAFVHRLGSDIGSVPMHLRRIRKALAAEPPDVNNMRSKDAVPDGAFILDQSQHEVMLDAVTEIEKRVQRLKQLERPLREIARLATIQFRPIELAGLLRKVVADVTPRNGSIQANLQLETGVIVDGNRGMLFDALRSLIENACDAMPHGGPLTVELNRLPGGQAEIRIEDKGIGIPPSNLPKMFRPGFSTKRSNTRGRSRGLGLFTCRAILRKHGGDIHIVSTASAPAAGAKQTSGTPVGSGAVETGTVVTVALPLLGDWTNAT